MKIIPQVGIHQTWGGDVSCGTLSLFTVSAHWDSRDPSGSLRISFMLLGVGVWVGYETAKYRQERHDRMANRVLELLTTHPEGAPQ